MGLFSARPFDLNKVILDELDKFQFIRVTHPLDVTRYKNNDLGGLAFLSNERFDRIDYSNWTQNRVFYSLYINTILPVPMWLRYTKPAAIKRAKKGEWYFNFMRGYHNLVHELGHLAELPKEKVIEWSFFSDDWRLGGRDKTDYYSYETAKREARAIAYSCFIREYFDQKNGVKPIGKQHYRWIFSRFLHRNVMRFDFKTMARLLEDYAEIEESLTIDQAMSDLRERLGILSDELVSMNKRQA